MALLKLDEQAALVVCASSLQQRTWATESLFGNYFGGGRTERLKIWQLLN